MEVIEGSIDLSKRMLEGIPEMLQKLLRDLLVRDPEDRIQYAREIITALGQPSETTNVDDQTLATQDLSLLVVPHLPTDTHLEELPAQPRRAPDLGGEKPIRKQSENQSTLKWKRLVATALCAAIASTVAGWISLIALAPNRTESTVDLESHQHRLRYVSLLKEGQRLLRAGESEVATRVFRRAEDLAPEESRVRDLRHLAESEALAVRTLLHDQQQLQALIDQARSAVRSSLFRRADELTAAVLLVDPENLEVLSLMQSSRKSPSRSRPEEKLTESTRTPAESESRSIKSTLQFPTTSVQTRTSQLQPGPISGAVSSTTSDLQIDVFSYLAKGIITMYANGDQILLHPFRFVRKAGLVRKRKSVGRLERTLELPTDSYEFRIYVSSDSIETQSITVAADLVGGDAHLLRLIIAENGSTSAQFD